MANLNDNPGHYPWQEQRWLELERLVGDDRLPHALMLTGPEEIGKLHFASALIQRLLCAGAAGNRACGQCKPCRLYVAGNHPDVFHLAPEKPGSAIKVDAVRQLRDFTGATAQQGGWRIVLVTPAEAMNINAANAFLKTLEEPGGSTLLLLVSHRSGGVLPTIRSRCRILPFPLPRADTALVWLRSRLTHPAQAEELLARAGGRPLRALRFVETELDEQYQQFDNAIRALESGRVSPIAAAEQLQVLPETESLQWLQDHVCRGIYEAVPAGLAGQRRAFLFLDRLSHTRRLMMSPANANRQFLWEELMLDWRSVAGADRT